MCEIILRLANNDGHCMVNYNVAHFTVLFLVRWTCNKEVISFLPHLVNMLLWLFVAHSHTFNSTAYHKIEYNVAARGTNVIGYNSLGWHSALHFTAYHKCHISQIWFWIISPTSQNLPPTIWFQGPYPVEIHRVFHLI